MENLNELYLLDQEGTKHEIHAIINELICWGKRCSWNTKEQLLNMNMEIHISENKEEDEEDECGDCNECNDELENKSSLEIAADIAEKKGEFPSSENTISNENESDNTTNLEATSIKNKGSDVTRTDISNENDDGSEEKLPLEGTGHEPILNEENGVENTEVL